MDLLLQWVGGICYLLNKIFLAKAEQSADQHQYYQERYFRIAAWLIYIVGLPCWVIILIWWRNWIAASVEAAGLPAMILGLVMALKNESDYRPPRWLDWLSRLAIALGFTVSLYDFGGITTINQVLEIVLVIGFLIGTYQLAYKRASGYLWYVLMHVACGWLMFIQDYPWLGAQQIVSLLFIWWAWQSSRKNLKLAFPPPTEE